MKDTGDRDSEETLKKVRNINNLVSTQLKSINLAKKYIFDPF